MPVELLDDDEDEELELDDDDVLELDELLDELLLDELDGESLPPHADKVAITKTAPASRTQPAGNKAAEIFMIPPDLTIFFMR